MIMRISIEKDPPIPLAIDKPFYYEILTPEATLFQGFVDNPAN